MGEFFDRVVCAVDGSDEAVEAALQGCRLAPQAPVTLLHIIDSLDAPAEETEQPAWLDARRRRAGTALVEARSHLARSGVPAPIETAVVEGERPAELRAAVMAGVGPAGPGATLMTMGSGEDTEMDQATPLPPPSVDRLTWRVLEAVDCSVLVGRRSGAGASFPERITVGVDGSPGAMAAHEAAEAIAAATGAELRTVTAVKGHPLDLAALLDADPPVGVDQLEWEQPDVALMEEGLSCDLLVVGRRDEYDQPPGDAGPHHHHAWNLAGTLGHEIRREFERNHGDLASDLDPLVAEVAAYSPVSVLVVHR